jgi:dihydrofolate reductase
MSAVSAAFFDQGVSRVGAVIAGRRTYDISEAWGGSGPMPGVPLFVLTHHVPDTVPAGDPPYTFVTDGIELAVEQAKTCARPSGRPRQPAAVDAPYDTVA